MQTDSKGRFYAKPPYPLHKPLKNIICITLLGAFAHFANAQSAYVADYSANPFLDGSATDLDDSSWLSSKYGRNGVVVSNPFNPTGNADEESFFAVNSGFYNHTVKSIGDKISLSTSFYSDSTTGSGARESTVYISLAPGLTALLGDIGDGSGNERISLGVGSAAAVVSNPGFTLTTDQWVDVLFSATYVGDNAGGIATFDYELRLRGGMVGNYNAQGVAQPSHSYYDIVGTAQSPAFGQEGDGDAQTIYWAAPTNVPEPSTVILLVTGAMAAVMRRSRQGA
ncbi:MAG: PEP-CTERM sorting domain-containing protein [Akkermansiaceae bacterium]|nr:PEP-CTERM sorting domain-containing protein [Akkermansiaceae bacterium]